MARSNSFKSSSLITSPNVESSCEGKDQHYSTKPIHFQEGGVHSNNIKSQAKKPKSCTSTSSLTTSEEGATEGGGNSIPDDPKSTPLEKSDFTFTN